MRKKPFTVMARWTMETAWFRRSRGWFVWRRYVSRRSRDEGLRALHKNHRDRNYIEFKEGSDAASK